MKDNFEPIPGQHSDDTDQASSDSIERKPTTISREFEFVPNTPDKTVELQPDSDLRLGVIVPVFDEYENGNIFRLLESFAKQTAPSNQFEINIVVNNTTDEALRKGQGFQDNQSTLELAMLLYGDRDEALGNEGLNEYRKGVVDKVRKKGLRVNFIDLSSQGFERNIGKVRDYGLSKIKDRFGQIGVDSEGIVAQLDADTTVEQRYIEKLINQFQDENLDTSFITMDYQAQEGPPEMFATSFHHRYKIAMQEWFNSLRGGSVTVGGPQTVARLRAYDAVGGIKHQDMAEDFELSKALSEATRYKFGTDIRVYTADRIRATGYDSRMRQERLEDPEYGYEEDMVYANPRISFAKSEIEALARSSSELVLDVTGVQDILSKYGLPFDKGKFDQYVLRASLKSGKELPLDHKVAIFGSNYFEEMGLQTSLSSNKWVDVATEAIIEQVGNAEGAALEESVRRSLLRASIRLSFSKRACEAIARAAKGESVPLTSKELEFLERNPWLAEMARNVNSDSDIETLRSEFPEFLATDLESSRLRRSLAGVHGLTTFIREARNNPESFPKTNTFLINMTKS